MYPPYRQYTLALQAMAELESETPSLQPTPIPAAPSLNQVLAQVGPLPREALFLGIAEDGLPVLLNLRDPIPGPILITGDPGAGKTKFLETIAHSAMYTHKADNLQYGVITRCTEDWKVFGASPHLAGLYSPLEGGAQEMLLALASWAHSNKSMRRSVLLLIDDLESVAQMDFEAIQNLRWLLIRGSSRGVWVFVTMNAGGYGDLIPWLGLFRTRLFGRIESGKTAAAVGADTASELNRLEGGRQFALRENGNWIQFWLPEIGDPA